MTTAEEQRNRRRIVVLVLLAGAVGLAFIGIGSYQTDVIQLRPAQDIVTLRVWGAGLLAGAAVLAGWQRWHQAAQVAVVFLLAEAAFLAVANIGEAFYLAYTAVAHPHRNTPQLGWVGAFLWCLVAYFAYDIARSNDVERNATEGR